MHQEEILKEKYGSETGFRVPEGYFEELNQRILSELPPYPAAQKSVPLSMWQRVKPYVYLAAMFAGIWMMMKVFHTVTTSDRLNLDNPPAAIVQALESHSFDDIMLFSTGSDYELEKEVSASYDSMEDFQEDFGYELLPEYQSVNLSANSGNRSGSARS
ncbi:MAG: hypothetical protein HDR88_15705 [Bacteroides sp.]|nr:hypothetical protein [Bacteroides sp.]